MLMKTVAKWGVIAVTVGVFVLLVGRFVTAERMPVLALSHYLPYPVYVMPAALGVVVAFIWLSWRWRAVAVVSLLSCMTVLMGLSWGRSEEGHGRIRFMTYNVKGYLAINRPEGLDLLAREIIEHQPDILALQDAGHLVDETGDVRSPALLRVIGALAPHVHAHDEYVLVSRWPIQGCRSSGIPVGDEPYVFLHCSIEVEGVGLDVITAHLITPRRGLRSKHHGRWLGVNDWEDNMMSRLRQAGLLAEYLRTLPPRPRIVAGDLNAVEASQVVRTLLNTGLRDAHSSAARGYGFTHGHSLLKGLSFLRIDHILVSPDMAVAAAFTGGADASEHRPVIADLYLHRD